MKTFAILIITALLISLPLLADITVSDAWVTACFQECSANNPDHKNCAEDSIQFIGQEYLRSKAGGKGGAYYTIVPGKDYMFSSDIAEHHMRELKEICPSAAKWLK